MRRLARVLFPLMCEPRYAKVRYAESTQTGFWFRTVAGCTFISYFTTSTGCSPGVRTDSRWMIMRLDLYLYIGGLCTVFIHVRVGIGHEPAGIVSLNYGGVVIIGDQRATGLGAMRLSNHTEQGCICTDAVDLPAGIENLMTTVLGICLRKHH